MMSELSFIERGEGFPIILIHGFPFNQQLWDDFAEELAPSFRVFTVDLPGFGRSPLPHHSFGIDDIAKILIEWMDEQALKKAVVVGHSLGGYIALSMAHQRPDLFSGLVLFHSTAYADSPEKKENRNKVLDFIEKNGVVAFTSNFITPLFADQSHPAIGKVRDLAIEASKETVIGYTQAMRDRVDRTNVLKSFPRPILIISGEKDSGIPVDAIKQQATLSDRIVTHILPNVGHMGMFESRPKTLKIMSDFALQSNQP